MKAGETYTFQVYDILDLTIQLSIDGGSTWEATPIVENLITDPEDVANIVTVEGQERVLAEYEWTVPQINSRNCIVKFIDNDTGEEILGDTFVLGISGGVTQNVFTGNIDIFSYVYGIY